MTNPRGVGGALLALLVLMALAAPLPGLADDKERGRRFGAGYFPNVELTTHDGRKVHFYDDLIKDRVVAINFIFTSCKDVCPGETARLRQVQQLLGDRVGDDVFMYSISTDPEVDTPDVLDKYRSQFRIAPGWEFITGKKDDIELLERKLGLLIEGLDDPNDHNVSLIIGNEATGRWMKRSPYDEPTVLAGLLGEALHNWKVKAKTGKRAYGEASRLPQFSRGEYIYRSRCVACHTMGEGDAVGPDLIGVVNERDPAWLARWLKEPDVLIAEQDPIAMELYEKYNELRMPNLSLNDIDVAAVIEYLEAETRRAEAARAAMAHGGHSGDAHSHH